MKDIKLFLLQVNFILYTKLKNGDLLIQMLELLWYNWKWFHLKNKEANYALKNCNFCKQLSLK